MTDGKLSMVSCQMRVAMADKKTIAGQDRGSLFRYIIFSRKSRKMGTNEEPFDEKFRSSKRDSQDCRQEWHKRWHDTEGVRVNEGIDPKQRSNETRGQTL